MDVQAVSGNFLSLYGAGRSGYETVSLGGYTTLLGGLPSSIPLASGLDLEGTSAYRDSSLSPAPSCKFHTTERDKTNKTCLICIVAKRP